MMSQSDGTPGSRRAMGSQCALQWGRSLSPGVFGEDGLDHPAKIEIFFLTLVFITTFEKRIP